MASLTIKGIPDELLDELRAEAERERRSVNQQAIVALERALLHRTDSFLARLDAFYGSHGFPDDDGLPDEGGGEFEGVRATDSGREPDV